MVNDLFLRNAFDRRDEDAIKQHKKLKNFMVHAERLNHDEAFSTWLFGHTKEQHDFQSISDAISEAAFLDEKYKIGLWTENKPLIKRKRD